MPVYHEYMMFVQDSYGIWYRIPVSKKEKFEEWLEIDKKPSCQIEEGDYDGPNFSDYKCMHPCNYMFKSIEVLKESKNV
jgi:hypothetical protein